MSQQKPPGKHVVQLGETTLEANRRLAQGQPSKGEQDWVGQLKQLRGQQAQVSRTNPVSAPSIDLGKPVDRQIVQTSSPTDTVSPDMLREQFQSGEMPMGMGAAFHVVQKQFKQHAGSRGQAEAAPAQTIPTTVGPVIQADVPSGAPQLNEVVQKYAVASASGAPAPETPGVGQESPRTDDDEEKRDKIREEEDTVRTIEEAFGAIELTDAEKKLPDLELRKRMHAKHRVALDDEDIDPGLRANVMYGSAERRHLIDRRCAPIDVDEMLLTGTCRQTVPINPDKDFSVEFRTLHTGEDTFITRRLAEAAAQASRMEFQQYVSRYELAFGLVRVKGVSYTDPTNIGEDGSISVDSDELDKVGNIVRQGKFTKKMNEIDRIPSPMFLELYTQYQWFKQRVRSAVAVFDLGNG